jgi:hypothetical protein
MGFITVKEKNINKRNDTTGIPSVGKKIKFEQT